MKITVLGDKATYRRVFPDNPYLDSPDVLFLSRNTPNAEVIAKAPDTEVILADAISVVDRELIEALPHLKLINSEGVAFNSYDIEAAREHGVFVCNNKGGNKGAVAEQAILLMLGLLRQVTAGDAAVRAGRQIEAKTRAFHEGITDLADCTVGLVGLGDIGEATARRLGAFGCDLVYYSPHRKSAALEQELGIRYLLLDDLLATSDIVSLHCAVTPSTTGMVDAAFLAKMRPGAYLVNTSRGELVDNVALAAALEAGTIAGAGLDTVAPEPVERDNPLLNLSEEAARHLLFSPHIGGITTGSIRRLQQHMWRNVELVEQGLRPDCIVNGL